MFKQDNALIIDSHEFFYLNILNGLKTKLFSYITNKFFFSPSFSVPCFSIVYVLKFIFGVNFNDRIDIFSEFFILLAFKFSIFFVKDKIFFIFFFSLLKSIKIFQKLNFKKLKDIFLFKKFNQFLNLYSFFIKRNVLPCNLKIFLNKRLKNFQNNTSINIFYFKITLLAFLNRAKVSSCRFLPRLPAKILLIGYQFDEYETGILYNNYKGLRFFFTDRIIYSFKVFTFNIISLIIYLLKKNFGALITINFRVFFVNFKLLILKYFLCLNKSSWFFLKNRLAKDRRHFLKFKFIKILKKLGYFSVKGKYIPISIFKKKINLYKYKENKFNKNLNKRNIKYIALRSLFFLLKNYDVCKRGLNKRDRRDPLLSLSYLLRSILYRKRKLYKILDKSFDVNDSLTILVSLVNNYRNDRDNLKWQFNKFYYDIQKRKSKFFKKFYNLKRNKNYNKYNNNYFHINVLRKVCGNVHLGQLEFLFSEVKRNMSASFDENFNKRNTNRNFNRHYCVNSINED